MVGSPNYGLFIFDGDGRASASSGPTVPTTSRRSSSGTTPSGDIRTEPTAFDGRSDYSAFINNGIPAGGLFTGAEVARQPSRSPVGRDRGRRVRPLLPPGLRHIDNLSHDALDINADAIAYALYLYASGTEAINN